MSKVIKDAPTSGKTDTIHVPKIKKVWLTKKPPKKLRDIDWESVRTYVEGAAMEQEQKEMRKVMKLFWWCSHYGKEPYKEEIWAWFDFEAVLDHPYGKIPTWLDMWDVNYEEAKKAVDEKKNELRDWDMPVTYVRLYNLMEKMDELYFNDLDLEEKIATVDEVIHTQHISGYFWNLDIPELRKDFEEEYL